MNYHGKSGRLTELFLGDLAAERFSPEEYLPSEQKLAEHYQASRNTIRRMLGELEAEGVLRRESNHRLQAAGIPVHNHAPRVPAGADGNRC